MGLDVDQLKLKSCTTDIVSLANWGGSPSIKCSSHVEKVGMHSPPFLKFLTNLIKSDFETNKCRELL
jgi:hypothetical protein